jgi:hypothetical protein
MEGNVLLNCLIPNTIRTDGRQCIVTLSNPKHYSNGWKAMYCYTVQSQTLFERMGGNVLLHCPIPNTIRTDGRQCIVKLSNPKHYSNGREAMYCYTVQSQTLFERMEGNVLLHCLIPNTIRTDGRQCIVTLSDPKYYSNGREAMYCYTV